MQQVVEVFQRMRKVAMKKLATTAEEAKSNLEYFEEARDGGLCVLPGVCGLDRVDHPMAQVRDREEKASKEKQSLEQQLKVERREREQQVAAISASIDKMSVQLQLVNHSYQDKLAETASKSQTVREIDQGLYMDKETELRKRVESLRKDLEALRQENREAEAHMYKKKTKTEQELETWLNEYDKDMTRKEEMYQEELAAYKEVQKRLEKLEKLIATFARERKEFEEAERQRKIAELTLRKRREAEAKAAKSEFDGREGSCGGVPVGTGY